MNIMNAESISLSPVSILTNPLDYIKSALNSNYVKDDTEKSHIEAMGISSCQVACLTYECCTGYGRGGKHIHH